MLGVVRRLGARPALALALVLPMLACGDTDTSAPDFGGETVPLPAERVGDLRLTRIDREVRAAPATVVVTEVDGAVVTLRAQRLSDITGDGGVLSDQGHPGPPLVDGRRTIELYDSVFNISPSLATEGSNPDEVIVASGRGRTLDELAAVLGAVALPFDGSAAVPGQQIGVLQIPHPDGIRVTYTAEGRAALVTIDEVSLSEQAAYRALLHDDPAASIDPLTEASCCPAGILEPPREVSVGARSGLVATLTPYQRVLLVEGDPGLVLRPSGGTEATEDDLITVAAALTAGSRAERDALAAALIDRQREAQAALAIAYEESLGWEVVERVDQGEHAVIVSSGTTPRPDRPTEALRICATIGGEGTATCLPEVSAGDLVLGERRSDVILGAAPPATRAVYIDFPEASIDTTVLLLEPRPGRPSVVFVSYTSVSEQIELTGEPMTERMAEIDVVARDAAGAEVARVPLFPHLRGG
jgi:hypothetical protein